MTAFRPRPTPLPPLREFNSPQVMEAQFLTARGDARNNSEGQGTLTMTLNTYWYDRIEATPGEAYWCSLMKLAADAETFARICDETYFVSDAFFRVITDITES
jgi:hypothetical protein